jgi:GTPase SAR1 family protein
MDADVFLICASVGQKSQFQSAKTKWEHEIKHFNPNRVPIILAGISPGPEHDDLEDGDGIHTRTEANVLPSDSMEYGREIAKAMGAHTYLECDLLSGKGVKALFDEVCFCFLFPVQSDRLASENKSEQLADGTKMCRRLSRHSDSIEEGGRRRERQR